MRKVFLFLLFREGGEEEVEEVWQQSDKNNPTTIPTRP